MRKTRRICLLLIHLVFWEGVSQLNYLNFISLFQNYKDFIREEIFARIDIIIYKEKMYFLGYFIFYTTAKIENRKIIIVRETYPLKWQCFKNHRHLFCRHLFVATVWRHLCLLHKKIVQYFFHRFVWMRYV